MSKNKSILSDLANRLALRAVQSIGKPKFTVWATLDIDRPKTIKNFGILGRELERAYQEGEANGRACAAAEAALLANPVLEPRAHTAGCLAINDSRGACSCGAIYKNTRLRTHSIECLAAGGGTQDDDCICGAHEANQKLKGATT